MPPNKLSIASLLSSLKAAPDVVEKGLKFRPVEQAEFVTPGPGTSIWRWGHIEPDDRLKLTYLFTDSDGVGAFLSFVFDTGNLIKEIEIWKGDGSSLNDIPAASALIKPEPGKIY